MQRGPGACGSGQIMSLKHNAEVSFAPRPDSADTKMCFFLTLFTPGELQRPCGRDSGGFNMSHSSPCVTKHLHYFYCLIWDWRGGKKKLAGVLPLRLKTSEMRKIEGGSRNEREHACMHVYIHTHAQAYTLTHMSECVARSHGQRCYMQCKHVWGCVLNTHYRGLGKLWERLGEKTNKPHRVAERGGEGPGGWGEASPSVIQVQ